MPSQKNIDTVTSLKEKLSRSKSVVLADYRGLTVNLQQKLRRQVRAAGGELMVIKNRLLKIAFKEAKYDIEPLITSFTGPSITLLAYEDELAPIKVLFEFAKEHELPKFKAGFFNQSPLTGEQLEQLAQLPNRVELIAKTVGTLKGPLYGLVNVLSANIRNLIYALKALQEKAVN
ncbi:MAG TPA: 50S ribosomal protein L10 [Patescibacteria group bacterium]|nr:50S ribosomal protein L10 [Patescibacteria group bacterium]